MDAAEKFVVLTEAINQIQTLRIENNSIQREKLKLRTQLQHLVSQYQQAYPGNVRLWEGGHPGAADDVSTVAG